MKNTLLFMTIALGFHLGIHAQPHADRNRELLIGSWDFDVQKPATPNQFRFLKSKPTSDKLDRKLIFNPIGEVMVLQNRRGIPCGNDSRFWVKPKPFSFSESGSEIFVEGNILNGATSFTIVELTATTLVLEGIPETN